MFTTNVQCKDIRNFDQGGASLWVFQQHSERARNKVYKLRDVTQNTGPLTVLLGNPQRRTSLIKVPDVLALDIGREHALVQYLTIRPIWAQNIILMSSAMHAEMEGKINNAIRWG